MSSKVRKPFRQAYVFVQYNALPQKNWSKTCNGSQNTNTNSLNARGPIQFCANSEFRLLRIPKTYLLINLFCLIFQLLLASALVASSVALPAGPPPPYHAPAPIPHHAPAYKIPPRPFAYAYGVADEYSGTNFDKKETQVRSFMAKFVTNLSTIVVIEWGFLDSRLSNSKDDNSKSTLMHFLHFNKSLYMTWETEGYITSTKNADNFQSVIMVFLRREVVGRGPVFVSKCHHLIMFFKDNRQIILMNLFLAKLTNDTCDLLNPIVVSLHVLYGCFV